MASKVVFIHDLPFKPRNELCRILDADKRWEELGGNYMGYDVTTITLIGHAIHRDKSPTWELLNKYSEKNGTIRRLFIMLTRMDHQRAMFVLKPYVEEKYHCLLRNESTLTTPFLSSKIEDIPRPSLSQFSLGSYNTQSSVSHSSTSKHTAGTCMSHKVRESSNQSKVKNDLANMNLNCSSTSLASKLKSLNVLPAAKATNCKRSHDSNNSKRNYSMKENSVSDNCVSEKINCVSKYPNLNAKQGKNLPGSSLNSPDDSLPDIMRIPYSEICKATDNFNESRVLGTGGFGTVYKGEWKGTSVAIKRLAPRKSTLSQSQQQVSLKQSLNELNILKCCRFDHILPLYAVSLDDVNAPCLIYQLMVNGSLEDRLLCKNKTPPLNWLQRSHIAESTSKGLNYLHTTYAKPLVHGDIKSANILLDANMEAKIGDFGLTREGPGCDYTHVKVSSVHGTECYLPPEYLRQRHLSPQVDIYCYGIVLLEIATGLRPLDPKREAKRLGDHVKICDESGRLDSLRDTKAGEENMLWFRELIKIGQVCSSTEKKKRPPMQEVLCQFEKIKSDVSMVDRIRRLSNDKGNPLKAGKVGSDLNLSPIEIQLMYDIQKDTQLAASTKNNLLCPPGNPGCSGIPLVIEQMNAISQSSNDSEFSIQSLDKRDSYISSESSQSESELSIKVTPVKEDNSGEIENTPSVSRSPPVPLLTMLQMQVSDIGEDPVSTSFCS